MQKFLMIAVLVYTICQMYEDEWFEFSNHHGKLLIMLFKLLEYKLELPYVSAKQRFISAFLRVYLPTECFFIFLGTPLIKPIVKTALYFMVLTSAIHYIPVKWINKIYDYKSISRMVLWFFQQSVFAVTFITRSTAMYNVYLGESNCNSYSVRLFVDVTKNEISSSQSKFFFVMFLFAFSESLCVDCVFLTEKYLYKGEFSFGKTGVNMIKYFGLITLCQIYFMLQSGNNWMTVFDKTQVNIF